MRKHSAFIYYYEQTPAVYNYYFLFLLLWQLKTLQRKPLARRAYKPSVRQEIADKSEGGVKVVSEVKFINRCLILIL